jgi:[ribosomal protein S18]-alanine N-acetyltransferase
MFGEVMLSRIGKIPEQNDMAPPSDNFMIRPMTTEDVGGVAVIESRCVGAARWGEAGYRDIAENGTRGWVASRDKILLGFVLVRVVADEMEILNLAVDPDARRKGIAARLVAQAIEAVNRADVERVYLEVRESNAGARAFYLSKGFAEQGRRKNYYSQPVEDALLLVLRLH